jgi:hypothetical protein
LFDGCFACSTNFYALVCDYHRILFLENGLPNSDLCSFVNDFSQGTLQDHSCLAVGRISDLLKFLVPKVGESFVLGHNVESQEVAQARPRPELAGALETILELAAL